MTRSATALARPVGDLHAHTEDIVDEVARSGQAVTITRGRKAAVVLVPKLEFDSLYRRYVIDAIERGEADASTAPLHEHADVMREARALVAAREQPPRSRGRRAR